MSDLEIDPAVSRLVSAWIDKYDPDPESDGIPAEVLDFTPRPARLGLGAKYVPQKANMSEADRRLAGALRKQKLDAQRQRAEPVDHTDDVDSRAVVVVKKRRGPGRPRKHPLPETSNAILVHPKQVASLKPTDNGDDDFGRPEHSAGIANGGNYAGKGDSASNGDFKKRKKIRSRQKNLKRDNRPKDQLPAYLTEETLRGGRVHREDIPNGNASS